MADDSRQQSEIQRMAAKGIAFLRQYGVSYTTKKVWRTLHFRLSPPRLLAKPLFTPEELEAQKHFSFPQNIRFSIIVPLYNTPESFLREMIASVQAQTYGNWQLCLADGSTPEYDYVQSICQEYVRQDSRIVYRKLEKNLGISGNTNAALELADGDYIALFDHDDLLHPAALHQMMLSICQEGADYLYTDEAIFIGTSDNIYTVNCKPDFFRENLLANNYICHFSAFSRRVLEETGSFRSQYDGSQDHDFILRATAKAKKIVHIPQLLYYWRSHPNSVAQSISSKSYAVEAGVHAVSDFLADQGIPASVTSDRNFPSIYHVSYTLTALPPVTVVISGEHAQKCAAVIREKTDYPDFRVYVLGHSPMNDILSQELGEKTVFLDSQIYDVEPDWLRQLLQQAQQPKIGIVGGKILTPGNKIWQADRVLSFGKALIGCPFRGEVPDSDGYIGLLTFAHPCSAVSAECMMVDTPLLRRLGGFDPALRGILAAADLCLRSEKLGFTTIWTPECICHSTQDTEATTQQHAALFRQKWASRLKSGDRYYGKALREYLEDYLCVRK